MALVSWPASRLSDRTGRRPLIFAAGLCGAVGSLVLVFSHYQWIPDGIVGPMAAFLKVPGLAHLDAGPDLGLAPGNASAGVICDFEGAEGYLAYDRDALHNRIRQEDVLPYVESARRVQFEI